MVLGAICTAPHGLALRASTPALVGRGRLVQANVLLDLPVVLGALIAPVVSMALFSSRGLAGVLLAELITGLWELVMLTLVRFGPRPRAQGARSVRTVLDHVQEGGAHVWKAGLALLLGMLFLTNFDMGMVDILITPLALAFTTVTKLGTILAVGASGAALSALLMLVWPGPQRRMPVILAAIAAEGVILFVASGRSPSTVLVSGVAFVLLFMDNVVHALSATVFQESVPEDALGRTLSFQQIVLLVPRPVAAVLAGPLLRKLFSPAMEGSGSGAVLLRRLLGTSSTPGILLLFAVLGALTFGAAALAGLALRTGASRRACAAV